MIKNTKNHKDIRIFLEREDIIKEIASDMELLGCVGEAENKILGYLLTLSRKLETPLSGIVVSSSGAGKSKLVDTLQKLTPPEDLVFTSRLTPQSLYYMQKDFLKHKLLIIEERTGSELADYAIRTLQSKGMLNLAIPIKNQTKFFTVEGPVSILETTISYTLNVENISRCFIIHLDESEEQTKRIHEYQRLVKTEKSIGLKEKAKKVIEFHHNLQRALERMPVIIPYAEKLSFPTNTPSSRRDNQKFLTLIEAVTLLYQYQCKKIYKNGMTFIESTTKDYEVAYDIFRKSYKQSLFMSHPKARDLLGKIMKIEKGIFSRRDIARLCGWPIYKVRDNIRYLEDSGLIEIMKKHKGKEILYSLNNNIRLTKPEELEENPSSTS